MTREHKILLWGMYGAINAGDEAVCYAVVQGLSTVFHNSKICIITHDASSSKKFTPLQDVTFFEGECFTHKFWMRFFKFLKCVRNADVMIVGGGGLFQDIYGGALPAGSILMAALGVIRGIPTFIVGVGVGPIKRNWLRRVISTIFPCVNHVSVRDKASFESLEEWKIPLDNVTLTADVVPSINFQKDFVAKKSEKDKNHICIAFRRWPGLDIKKSGELLDELASRGYKIRLLCFSSSRDPSFYKEVLNICSLETQAIVELVIPKNLQELIPLISQSKFMLSMRLHGCIFAIGLNTPLIPIIYEEKVRGFAKQLQLEDRLKQVEDIGANLADEIDHLENYWNIRRREIQRRYSKIYKKSWKNFELIKENLENSPKKRLQKKEKLLVLISIGVLLLIGFWWEIWRALTWPFRKVRNL